MPTSTINTTSAFAAPETRFRHHHRQKPGSRSRVEHAETFNLDRVEADWGRVKRMRPTALLIGVVFLLVGGPTTAAAAVAVLTPLAAFATWLRSD